MQSLCAKAIVLTLGLAVTASAGAASDGFSYRQVADMIYKLALANRTAYTRDIVQRLANKESVISASEHYLDEKGLPLPAQMFRLTADEIDTNDFWLSLRSLTPINFANGPITALEEKGLEYVMANPGEGFYAEDNSAGRPGFVAIYADVAGVQACVACHNSHPQSPRRDFKLNDVMGGIVVRVFAPQ